MELARKVRWARRVYVIGNGGSFANAEHMANDLQACGIRAHTVNSAFFSATANDMGYEASFSRWISVHGEVGDLLIALSGSGKSPNILNAVATAREIGMEVWEEYGAKKGLDMQASEEAQITLSHDLMRELRG